MERKAMHYVGIDVGSTATKVAVLDGGGALARTLLCPTGFSSVDAARRVRALLDEAGIDVEEAAVVATGYGRVAAVSYTHLDVYKRQGATCPLQSVP